MDRVLTPAEATSAAAIQREIDLVARTGGRVVLPPMELELDRGLRLASGVELCGQGPETVLRKGPGRAYPLSGYHNYGMQDVPLQSAAGLQAGMTVSIHDARTHGGFYETFATITWIDADWVGLDHGIEADYRAEHAPRLTTVYPLVFGHGICDAALRQLTLEGQRHCNPITMGGCRGGAVYLAGSCRVEIAEVHERDYNGEGLSFQMCRDITIRDCTFADNTGNGLHPGAGSTNVLFERCGGHGNGRAGFFFCVRANHITVRDCAFAGNAVGMSVGTRDCHNLIEACAMTGNQGPGILLRECPPPTEVHSCRIRGCRLADNATVAGNGQVDVVCPAHEIILEGNTITGTPDRPAVAAADGARALYLQDNTIAGGAAAVRVPAAALTAAPPALECGFGDWPDSRFRHLPTPLHTA